MTAREEMESVKLNLHQTAIMLQNCQLWLNQAWEHLQKLNEELEGASASDTKETGTKEDGVKVM